MLFNCRQLARIAISEQQRFRMRPSHAYWERGPYMLLWKAAPYNAGASLDEVVRALARWTKCVRADIVKLVRCVIARVQFAAEQNHKCCHVAILHTYSALMQLGYKSIPLLRCFLQVFHLELGINVLRGSCAKGHQRRAKSRSAWLLEHAPPFVAFILWGYLL